MSDKDINIHVRGKDTEQTKRDVDGVSESVKGLGQTTAETGRQISDNSEKISIWTSLLSKAGNYLLGIFGAAALIRETTAAIREQSAAMKEHAEIATEQQNKLLRLQFLGDYYKEKPELRKQVMAASEAARRPFEDIAGAMYDLRNLGEGLTEKQRQDILDKSIELGRTMPDTPLNQIIKSMVFYTKQTKETDIGRVQNIVKQTLTEAGGEPGQAAEQLSGFLPTGLSAGMSGEEAAGVWAYATSQFPDSGKATMGLRGIVNALQGKGTDDSKKLLRRLGISPGTPFLQQIQQLSQAQAAGKLNLKGVETLVSEREAPILLALLQNVPAMMKTIEDITAAGQSPENLTQKSIEGLYGTDEMARMEDTSRLLDLKITNVKAMDTAAVKREAGKKLQEFTYSKMTDSRFLVRFLKLFDLIPDYIFGMHRWDKAAENISQTSAEPNQPQNIIVNNNYGDKFYPAVGETDANRDDPNAI